MSSEPEEQIFPDCAECAPCRCDDECDCNGGVCSMCGHWTDMTTNKVYIVFDREDYVINERFEGAILHHLEPEIAVWIPRELHETIKHDLLTGKGMPELNEAIARWMG